MMRPGRGPVRPQALDDEIRDGEPRKMTVPMVLPNDGWAAATDMPVGPSQ